MTDQEGAQKSGLSRRDFLKLMGAAGTGLAFAPFVPWGHAKSLIVHLLDRSYID